MRKRIVTVLVFVSILALIVSFYIRHASRTPQTGSRSTDPSSWIAQVFQHDRPMIRHWSVDDFANDLDQSLENRDVQRGKAIYVSAGCIQCHKVAGVGADIGQDLTGIGRRYTPEQILRQTLEPAKSIDDEYKLRMYMMSDGKVIRGIRKKENAGKIWVSVDPTSESDLTVLDRDEIDETIVSKASPMPSGLLDVFDREEILDLMAYLLSDENG